MLATNIKKLRKNTTYLKHKSLKKSEIIYSAPIKIDLGSKESLTLETLTKLANVFKIKIDELVGRK